MSHRKQQVESTLRKLISDTLTRQVSDPRILGLVSVTRVDVSPDFRHAAVYVSVIPDHYQRRTVQGLRHAAGYIHALVYKALEMRSVPQLDFRLDESLKKQAQVLDAIEQTKVGGSSPSANGPSVGAGGVGDGDEA